MYRRVNEIRQSKDERGEKVTSEEFEKIYKLYFSDVYYYVLSLSKDKNISEDITAETFFKALKAIEDFRGDSSLKTWLFQIARNEYFSYLRKNKKIILNNDFKNFYEESISLEKSFIADTQVKSIWDKINALEDPYREVFRLRFYGELKFKTIGKLYGKTENWACVTFYRARKKLQKKLEGNL